MAVISARIGTRTGERQGQADLKVPPGAFKLISGQATDIVGAVSGHRPASRGLLPRLSRRQVRPEVRRASAAAPYGHVGLVISVPNVPARDYRWVELSDAESSPLHAESSAAGIFATELKAQRGRLGWTQVQLGQRIGYSGSFISDVERGARWASLDFAQRCDKEMSIPGTLERMHELTRREAYPSWFSPVIPFEAAAVRIHGWALGAVPGLLQTEGYARSVIQARRPEADEAAIERTVAARLERQAILKHAERGGPGPAVHRARSRRSRGTDRPVREP